MSKKPPPPTLCEESTVPCSSYKSNVDDVETVCLPVCATKVTLTKALSVHVICACACGATATHMATLRKPAFIIFNVYSPAEVGVCAPAAVRRRKILSMVARQST